MGQTLVLWPSRRKIVGMLLASFAFVVVGVFLIPSGHWVGWLSVAVFGLGVLVFVLQLLPQSAYLRVGPDGFTVCTLFRAHSCRWSDVGPFKVVRVGPKDMVVFSFSDQYRGPRRLARLNTNLVGAEAAIAVDGTWNIRMEELAAVLNRYRECYGAV
jgi:hypothetical protein